MYMTKEMDLGEIADRVEAGAMLLDQENPGWHRHVVAEKIKILSCTKCILGQIYGQFGDGMKKLAIKGFSGDYGFNCSHRDVEKVETAWCDQIALRVLLDEIEEKSFAASDIGVRTEAELAVA